MRILYDSKKRIHKDPFGTLTPDQVCTLNIHIPANVGALKAECVIRMDGTGSEQIVTMLPVETSLAEKERGKSKTASRKGGGMITIWGITAPASGGTAPCNALQACCPSRSPDPFRF